MNKTYPKNWKKIAERLKEQAGYKCQWCGVEGELHNDNGRQLSVHHLDGDTTNNNPANLVVLCAICHLRDQQRVTRAIRRQRLEDAGQLTLFTEEERRRSVWQR